MPRSASDRKFGFLASGLVRIFTAADPAEVLETLLLLGIDPRSEDAFDSLAEAVVAVWAAPIVAVLGKFDDIFGFINDIERLNQTLSGHEPREELTILARIAQAGVRSTQEELARLQFLFKQRMDEATEEFPQFTWPATPGVFEAA